MVGQGYNYLYGPNYSLEEIFETGIANLEKSIPPSVPSINKKKQKSSMKRKAATFDNSEDKDSDEKQKDRKFWQYHGTFRHTIDNCKTPKALIRQIF